MQHGINQNSLKVEAIQRLYESYHTVFNSTFLVKLLYNQRDGYRTIVALYNKEKHIIGTRRTACQSQCQCLFDRVLKVVESTDVHSENACHEVLVASSIHKILEVS